MSTFLLSERLSLATDRLLYRDPQPVIMQQMSKLHVSVGLLSLGNLMKSGRTGVIKIIGFRGDRGYQDNTTESTKKGSHGLTEAQATISTILCMYTMAVNLVLNSYQWQQVCLWLFVRSWYSFPPIGLSWPALIWRFLSCFIAFCFVLSSCWRRMEGGLALGERGNEGS